MSVLTAKGKKTVKRTRLVKVIERGTEGSFVMEIVDGKKTTRYAVDHIDPDGRSYHVSKEIYVADDGEITYACPYVTCFEPHGSNCTCEGAEYGWECVHQASIKALANAGKI